MKAQVIWAIFLNAQNLAWQLIKVDEGEPLPLSILAYSGIVLMGGSMSVNDDLPWIAPLLTLIREARDHNVPLLGHCSSGPARIAPRRRWH